MSTSRKIAWGAWVIASIFYAYQYVLRVMPSIILPEIMEQFNIDTAIFGQFSGAYYLGYCVMHLPIGIMLDRFGPKRVMAGCIVITTMGLLPLVFATHWAYPIMGRFFMGMGSSAAILGAFNIIRMTFNEKHFSRMLSFSVAIGLMGALYGGVPVSYLCAAYGHKIVIEMLMIVGLILAAITYILVPQSKGIHTSSIRHDIKTVFANSRVLWVCFLAGIMVGPMEGFADAFGPEFLKQAYGFEATIANSITSMIYIGMCFAPLLSRVAEKTGRYMETIAGAGFIMMIAFVMLVSGVLDAKIMTGSFFMVGICCAYQILAIYKASTYVPPHVAGLTTAVANMIIMSFGYVFHSVIGIIIKTFGDYGAAMAFTYGISFIPITLGIGVIGFMVIAHKERSNVHALRIR